MAVKLKKYTNIPGAAVAVYRLVTGKQGGIPFKVPLNQARPNYVTLPLY